ncbi:hypothetical protein CMV30_19045 [Nibricoccus aquaticus]|uniref:Uncharacterized protein n=1 Tax=Nibricoccus aquaticus TaxID=2576891 RepID=A0A290QB00_9BACT|nr:hypothetical protein [Nibricoccus aquaticus]ATC65875.1 hypothetical protein CMV30_19045 [Nibricoccus aquaticus]
MSKKVWAFKPWGSDEPAPDFDVVKSFMDYTKRAASQEAEDAITAELEAEGFRYTADDVIKDNLSLFALANASKYRDLRARIESFYGLRRIGKIINEQNAEMLWGVFMAGVSSGTYNAYLRRDESLGREPQKEEIFAKIEAAYKLLGVRRKPRAKELIDLVPEGWKSSPANFANYVSQWWKCRQK